MDTSARSIAKAVTYRALGSSVTALIILLLTHKVALSLGAGGLDAGAKTLVYFLHERIWDRLSFGRQRVQTREGEEVFK